MLDVTRGGWGLLALALAVGPSWSCASPRGPVETYAQAAIDEGGRLQLATTDGRSIVPRLEDEQMGFAEAAISPDRFTAGWLALYPNCCTSYPVALALVTYSSGRVRIFGGDDLPIARWRFEAEGREVSFRLETVHGGFGVRYELRDVATGELRSAFEPEAGGVAPAWVERLDGRPD